MQGKVEVTLPARARAAGMTDLGQRLASSLSACYKPGDPGTDRTPHLPGPWSRQTGSASMNEPPCALPCIPRCQGSTGSLGTTSPPPLSLPFNFYRTSRSNQWFNLRRKQQARPQDTLLGLPWVPSQKALLPIGTFYHHPPTAGPPGDEFRG